MRNISWMFWHKVNCFIKEKINLMISLMKQHITHKLNFTLYVINVFSGGSSVIEINFIFQSKVRQWPSRVGLLLLSSKRLPERVGDRVYNRQTQYLRLSILYWKSENNIISVFVNNMYLVSSCFTHPTHIIYRKQNN